MDCTETLTSTGEGAWGEHPVEYALSTVRRTWRGRHTPEVRSNESFRVSFALGGREPDFREFATEEERDAFLAASIGGRRPGGAGPRLLRGCPRPWGSELAGLVVDAVTFVADYLELQFDGERAAFHVWPVLRLHGKELRVDDAEYANGLRSLIGQRVMGADVYVDDGIVVRFETAEMVVPPDVVRHAEWDVIEGVGGYVTRSQPPFD